MSLTDKVMSSIDKYVDDGPHEIPCPKCKEKFIVKKGENTCPHCNHQFIASFEHDM